MKPWDDLNSIRDSLMKLWDRGSCYGAECFPYRHRITSPINKDIGTRFDEVGRWFDKLIQDSKKFTDCFEWEYRSFSNRIQGTQQLPCAMRFEQPDDLARFLGRLQDIRAYRSATKEVLSAFPSLEPWCEKNPLKLLKYADEWSNIVSILWFFLEKSNRGVYLRQISLPGIHTKYIESRIGLIDELLRSIEAAGFDHNQNEDQRSFEERRGFKTREPTIRFRILDPCLAIHGLRDLQIPVSDFKNLNLAVKSIFVTENKINGLCFPDYPMAMVVFGLGYALDTLSSVNWLKNKTIYYWGDIDTHGFAMLDRMRSYFPLVRSILMDETTWEQHSSFRVCEATPCHSLLNRLTEEEYRLYQQLVTLSEQQEPSRLEQELIDYDWLVRNLDGLVKPGEQE